ncbi:ScbA/BarX family gamma-butyrolactone biosynthesis protein [Streptomyces sp. NPDC006285]|uniref:ScbA/BarX family gamma-butyrolactone biosynthesis protein n=1 Tax=Streptomyces sp. NPDC006285 TaxID=3364742 RepID=UPI0036A5DC13
MTVSTFHDERTPVDGAPAESLRRTVNVLGAFHHMALTTTVPKEFVHRAAVAEVMLTDWQRTDEAHFTVAAQWPRSHSFFTPSQTGHHDPLIAAETIRQVGTLLGHAEFGVPLDHQFLLQELVVEVQPEQLAVGGTPASLDLDITCTEIKKRGENLSGLRYEAVIRRDGALAATGSLSYTCTTPAVYRRLRGHHVLDGPLNPIALTAPAAPQSVGRMSPVDVVLSPIGEADRWQLRVDTRHPVLFDHPVDHIPGMLLIEAARQAAAATLGHESFMPLGLTSEFKHYGELDAPCFIEARRLPRTAAGVDTVVVSGHQDGHEVFRSTVTAVRPTD